MCLTRASRLSAGARSSVRQQGPGRAQLVEQQLEPQLGRLVLDDEQQLVVLRRVAARLLRGEQQVEPQVVAVGHRRAEVALDALLELAHVRCLARSLCHGCKVVGVLVYRRTGRHDSPDARERTRTGVAGPPGRAPSGQVLRQQRRGRRDPTYRIEEAGADLARHPHAGGPGHAVRRSPPAARRGPRRGLGRGAEWALDQVPALLGADDDPSGFEPRHPLLAEA